MRTVLALFIVGTLLLPLAAAQANPMSPEGYWQTIDDDGKTPRSVVHLWLHEGKVFGRIVKLFRQPGEELDPVCDQCKGELKNKRTIGLSIISGLEQAGSEWTRGGILDPENGKSYRCFIEVQDGGKRLKVRGYIGLSLLGRTQYWNRTSKPSNEIEVLPAK